MKLYGGGFGGIAGLGGGYLDARPRMMATKVVETGVSFIVGFFGGGWMRDVGGCVRWKNRRRCGKLMGNIEGEGREGEDSTSFISSTTNCFFSLQEDSEQTPFPLSNHL